MEKVKKIINNKKTLLIIIISILIIILIAIILKNSFTKKKENPTSMKISDKVVELDGTKKYESDSFSKEHCIQDICLYDVTVYSASNIGRVEYIIENKSSEVKSGYLKLYFGDKLVFISYSKLEPNKSMRGSTQFTGDFSNVNDYTLAEMTKDEINNIESGK